MADTMVNAIAAITDSGIGGIVNAAGDNADFVRVMSAIIWKFDSSVHVCVGDNRLEYTLHVFVPGSVWEIARSSERHTDARDDPIGMGDYMLYNAFEIAGSAYYNCTVFADRTPAGASYNPAMRDVYAFDYSEDECRKIRFVDAVSAAGTWMSGPGRAAVHPASDLFVRQSAGGVFPYTPTQWRAPERALCSIGATWVIRDDDDAFVHFAEIRCGDGSFPADPHTVGDVVALLPASSREKLLVGVELDVATSRPDGPAADVFGGMLPCREAARGAYSQLPFTPETIAALHRAGIRPPVGAAIIPYATTGSRGRSCRPLDPRETLVVLIPPDGDISAAHETIRMLHAKKLPVGAAIAWLDHVSGPLCDMGPTYVRPY